MFDGTFRDPWLLSLSLLAPLAWWLCRRTPPLASYSSLGWLASIRPSWRVRLEWLPRLLLAAAIVAISVGLARPRSPRAETHVSGQGIAMMLVADHSSSMDARDLVPDDLQQNRLDVTKRVLRDFVLGDKSGAKGRPNDLIGLVSFAGYADGICPLTLDHHNLVQMIDELEIADVEDDGTAIGDGLALGVERLRKSKAVSKVIILLTDGSNNAGAIDPLVAARLAADLKIRVYCIGAGTRGIAPQPRIDAFGRTVLVQTPVDIDERLLRKIADQTGGRYFRATDARSLGEIYRQIDALERSQVTERRYLQYDEHFPRWVSASVVLVSLALILGNTVFRSSP